MSIYRFPEPEARHSIPDLIRQLFRDFTELVQQQILLIKTETREEAQRLSKALIYGLVGLILLQVTLIFSGNLLMLVFLTYNGSIFWSTLLTTGLFLVLTALFVGLCVRQIRSAQALLKQQE